MKLNVLSSVNTTELDGYNNVRLEEISTLVDDSECMEILVIDVLETVPISMVGDAMRLLVSKMRHGSKLTVSGTNVRQVCRQVVNQSLDIKKANELLFGNNGQKNCCLSMNTICDSLMELGLKVVTKRLDGTSMYVVAERL